MTNQKQRVLTASYFEELKTNIPKNLLRYQQGTMQIDLSKTVLMQDMEEPKNLTEKFNAIQKTPDSDFQAAKFLYDAFHNLTPVESAYLPFWTYVSHVYMYNFLNKRLNVSQLTENEVKRYFFVNDNTRNIETYVPALFHMAKLTCDETRDDPYELTELFFKFVPSLRAEILKNKIFGNREPLIGLMRYIKEHKQLMSGLTMNYSRGSNIPFNKIKKIFETIGVGMDLTLYKSDDYYEIIKSCLNDK